MTQFSSRTADIRAAAKHDDGRAEPLLTALLADLFSIEARHVAINRDQYSLNSLNGFFDTTDGAFFFKFHQEEGEEQMSGEYYRADILARAGLPVDQPVYMSTLPGEQILVYRRRTDPRFSDVLRALDLEDEPGRRAAAVAAEATLSDRVTAVYRQTLHPIAPEQSGAEPVHRLFFERLVDPPTGSYPGGRLKSFYVDRTFELPGVSLSWDQFSRARFAINGKHYRHTIGELFDLAHDRLNPRRLADAGGVVAHGDAHNANVWYSEGQGGPSLSFFDPAFAGEHVPTLLAEVKTTFHNVIAHPLWLYDPEEAAKRYAVTATYANGTLAIDTDWVLSPAREDLLRVKAERAWRPLLQDLQDRNLLPEDWRQVIRLALFLCPTLVMNLRAGAGRHNPVSSAIGFANAMRVGSEPGSGSDFMTEFFGSIAPR
jgi:Ser/Thr protein kinase RdoA (MazF antagonist)